MYRRYIVNPAMYEQRYGSEWDLIASELVQT